MQRNTDNEQKFLLQSMPSTEYLAQAILREVEVGYLETTAEREVKVLKYPLQNEYTLTQKVAKSYDDRQKSKVMISEDVFNKR